MKQILSTLILIAAFGGLVTVMAMRSGLAVAFLVFGIATGTMALITLGSWLIIAGEHSMKQQILGALILIAAFGGLVTVMAMRSGFAVPFLVFGIATGTMALITLGEWLIIAGKHSMKQQILGILLLVAVFIGLITMMALQSVPVVTVLFWAAALGAITLITFNVERMIAYKPSVKKEILGTLLLIASLDGLITIMAMVNGLAAAVLLWAVVLGTIGFMSFVGWLIIDA